MSEAKSVAVLVYRNVNGLDCWAITDAAPGTLLEFVNIQQQEHS